MLFNEEFLVSASHQLALITSLPFVHTARRYYRLNGYSEHMGSAKFDWQQLIFCRELWQTRLFRGSKSRNKVSVGEPAEGSLNNFKNMFFLAEQLVIFFMSSFGREKKYFTVNFFMGFGQRNRLLGEGISNSFFP